MNYLYGFIVWSLSNSVLSQTISEETIAKQKVGSALATGNPLMILFSLLFIIALILFLAWFVKKLSGSHFIANQSMKVIAALSLGAREKAVLIEIGDKQLLLGVAPGRVSSLHVFDEKIIVLDRDSGDDFSSKLKRLLKADPDVKDQPSSVENKS